MDTDISLTERRYKVVRKHLDDLGYRQPLVIDSLPLVERIVSDLLHTTESLRHYKLLAQQSFEECNQLGIGVEPYKRDNAKLVQENNELHIKLLYQKEDVEKALKELKARLRKLESENSDLQFISSQHLSRVRALELESAEKSRKILQLQGKSSKALITTPGGKKKCVPLRRPTLEIDSPLKPGKPWQERFWSVSAQAKDPHIVNMCDLADQRLSCLCREVNLLKEERVQQSELVATYRNQLKNRDREIDRLTRMLEGGRPINVVNNDCCCSDLESRLAALTADFQKLDKKNRHLEHQARDAVLKQHEAMNRAVKLSDRNAVLEKELHDLNFFAHAVNSDCTSNVKETSKRASQIQLSLQGSLSQVNDLEREVLELKRLNQEARAEFEKLRNEKHSLHKILEATLDDKKAVTDRVNQFTVIEHDLNIEIDRLTEAVKAQKLRIAELESRLLSQESQPVIAEADPSKAPPVGQKKKKLISKTVKSVERKAPVTKGPLVKEKSKRETRMKEGARPARPVSPSDADSDSADGDGKNDDRTELIGRLQVERDFYFQELHNLKEQHAKVPPQDDSENAELRRRLQRLDRDLAEARQAAQQVCNEKTSLQVRLDACLEREGDRTSPALVTATLKTAVERAERERDEAKGDSQRLQEERDALRERLKIATETQVSEHSRFEQALLDGEERVRRAEAERRELLGSQASVRATVAGLEDQLKQCRDRAEQAEHELSQQRMMYSQIKSLHEQTDRALADTQGHLSRDESELGQARERIRELERNRAALDREVALMKTERSSLKAGLEQVDREKDSLLIEMDEKTERAAQLNQELNAKESKVHSLQEKVNELQRKQSVILDETACKEKLLRNSEQEVQSLRAELCTLQRTHEAALRELRRLDDDLAAATQDGRHAQAELEAARREAEDLKRQLQDYVEEVRRIEELLAHKEGERGELLDHFRSLSAEARSLESNNQSLNHEAEDTKTRLDSAQHRIMDLEMLVETRDSLICGYENQISDLTSHVAGLEGRLQAEADQKARLETDISAVRDLCVKLDSQKDSLIEATAESNSMKTELEHEVSRLQDELDSVRDELTKHRDTVKSLKECMCVSRHESSEGRVANQELQAEINALHRRIDELQQRLDSETSEVRRYQEQAIEYSQQVSELRRELTNEKFEKARLTEDSRRDVASGESIAAFRSPIPISSGSSTTPSGATHTLKSADESESDDSDEEEDEYK